jgi:AhpD family alkylhydroperoxidase
MHMLDWNTYRQQLLEGVGGFGKLNPDIIKGYTTLSRAGQKAGHLDEKTRELIALAVAITLRCDGCITVHTAAARERGATRKRSPKRWVCGLRQCRRGRCLFHPGSMISTPPPKSIPRLRRTHDRHLRLPLSWIAHSDRVGIPLMRVAIAIVFLWIGAPQIRAL